MASSPSNPHMNWNSRSLHEEWKRFQEHVELMFQGPLDNANEAKKAAYLLIWVDEQGREICRSWNLTNEERKNYELLITKFTNHVTPRKNPLFARYLFLERRQKTDETFENFVTETRNLVKDCEYDKPEEMVRDIIVCGILSSSIREKLLDKGAALTMEEAIDIAITHETTQTHLRSMSNKSSSVDTIKEKKSWHDDHSKEKPKPHEKLCRKCGRSHGTSFKDCPAAEATAGSTAGCCPQGTPLWWSRA